MTYDCVVHADGSAGLPDPVVRQQVLTRRLCGLCGDWLGTEVAFIATEGQARRRRFSSPGLHVDCARFAFSAMPFFANARPARSETGFLRGQHLSLYICPDYRVSRAGLLAIRVLPGSRIDTLPLIKAEPPSRVERHDGWESMARLIAAEAGCPPHAETVVSGCLEHLHRLIPSERTRIAEREQASDLPTGVNGPITNMRTTFAPRNLRIEANGFPLTYDNAVKADGVAEGPTDMRIERRLLRTRRCLVCADDLGSEVAFIGTTRAARSGWYPTPGMHVDCARFAFAVCPFLARPEWTPATHALRHTRTPQLVLVIADSYRYAPWRWWLALKLLSVYRRANFGSAKALGVFHEERHDGRREMLAYLNEHAGCPAHREQALTASPAHAGNRSGHAAPP